MSVSLLNKYPIPEAFPTILHDYIREVLRNSPEDILDFSVQYFASLQEKKSDTKFKYNKSSGRPVSNITNNENNKTFENTKSTMNFKYGDNQNIEPILNQQEDQIAEKDENVNTYSNNSNAFSPKNTIDANKFQGDALQNHYQQIDQPVHTDSNEKSYSQNASDGNATKSVYSKETLQKAGNFVDDVIKDSQMKLDNDTNANNTLYSKTTMRNAGEFVNDVFKQSFEKLNQPKMGMPLNIPRRLYKRQEIL